MHREDCRTEGIAFLDPSNRKRAASQSDEGGSRPGP